MGHSDWRYHAHNIYCLNNVYLNCSFICSVQSPPKRSDCIKESLKSLKAIQSVVNMSEKEDLAKQEAPPEYEPSDKIPPAGVVAQPVQAVTRTVHN